jgi:formylmethanofuran dehydrogenase subunit E
MIPMKRLDELLRECAAAHARLCPRQVLGVRMGLLAGRVLDLDLPQAAKRLLTIAETDGCLVDGLAAATNCRVGRRTLRIEDYGKVAATFVDTHAEQAIRITPRAEARARAWEYAPQARNRWEAQLVGYQRMPDEALLSWQWVMLADALQTTLGRHGQRATCEACREEIINQREVLIEGTVLCRACAGRAYYLLPLEQPAAPARCKSLV